MPTHTEAPWHALRAALDGLRSEVLAIEQKAASLLAGVRAEQRDSAVNLLHYVALRQRDHWELQGLLAAHGLSSLGRAEAHVLATLQAVLALLDTILGGLRSCFRSGCSSCRLALTLTRHDVARNRG